MAIDDNTTYGLTGAQIKDLTSKIKESSVGMERVTEEGYADGFLYTTLSGGDRIGFTIDDGDNSALLYFDDVYPNIRVAGIEYVDAGLATKADASAIPTNVSQLTNDANYQNATQVSSAIATAVGQITEFSFEVVQTLPATGDASTIYLVPITGSAQNTYDEYLYVSNAWEKIGSTDIDLSNYVQFTDLATVATTGDYNDLTNLPEGMVVLEYGTSTWADFLAAYNDNRVVYCRASSGSDPSVGDKTRMAFMAYVTNPANPTLVEFQYYRSVTTKSASNQTDQVVVYKLANDGTWSVETRNTNVKIAAGTNMTSSYSGGVLTLNATAQTQQQTDWNQSDTTAVDFIKNKPTIPTVNNATLTIQKNGTNVATFTANSSTNATANITVPTITMQTTDPGEGATLAANSFIAVYQ